MGKKRYEGEWHPVQVRNDKDLDARLMHGEVPHVAIGATVHQMRLIDEGRARFRADGSVEILDEAEAAKRQARMKASKDAAAAAQKRLAGERAESRAVADSVKSDVRAASSGSRKRSRGRAAAISALLDDAAGVSDDGRMRVGTVRKVGR